MLVLLGIPRDMEDKQRDVIVTNFFNGFEDTAEEAGTTIRGGQTVRCPWLLLGGVATSVSTSDEMAVIDGAQPGDVLVLSKPIGGQVAVNSYEWLKKGSERIDELKLDKTKIIRAYQQVLEQMCRLNRNAARMALKYKTHASTDVTGFGILGHADNLAKAQKKKVEFVIDALPVIEYTDEISRKMGNGFNLFGGKAAETSGGLLMAISQANAEALCEELEILDGFPAWIIGKVVSSDKPGARIVSNPKIISVPSRIHSS
ncbi:hypothetical protein AB6A40_008888 [Gnathostoma spinigerum]|uniref:PurM-like C-terminal domain-containing protein n=1 Tax=Gnathostoma spinigerum TaxID=75299 RepID=A0ABD6EVG1_9BILA